MTVFFFLNKVYKEVIITKITTKSVPQEIGTQDDLEKRPWRQHTKLKCRKASLQTGPGTWHLDFKLLIFRK